MVMIDRSSEVFITVAKAVLSKSFERFGKMDPYATVEWKNESGTNAKIATTNIDYNSHFTPVWNYVCKSQAYNPETGNCSVKIDIYDKEQVTKDDFCGSCQTTVSFLLAQPETPPYHELPMMLKGEQTGVCYVSAKLIRGKSKVVHGEEILSGIDSSRFEPPVKRGKSPIYTLTLKNPKKGQSRSQYVGKDITCCGAEVEFYQFLRAERRKSDASARYFHGLLDYAFPYAGILNTYEGTDDGSRIELLVIKNLHDRSRSLRLIDLKIGSKEADPNSSSRFLGKKTKKTTNSTQQGFRLEGFENMPESLKSLDPTLDRSFLQMTLTSLSSCESKGRQKQLNKLNGSDIFTYFSDIHLNDFDDDTLDIEEYLTKEEYIELIMYAIVRSLTRLSVICHKVVLPQKWIGSSVLVGFDVGTIPKRSTPKSAVYESAMVHIFDWGDSTLNTLETNKVLDPVAHQKYTKVWNDYKDGVDGLSWNAARYYFNRYGNSFGWKFINITLFDYDTSSADDRMGDVLLTVKGTKTGVFPVMKGEKSFGSLTCSLAWVPYPSQSRLRGVWRLFIIQAKGLPNLDLGGVSDPYCVIRVISSTGHEFCQYSTVRENTLNPVWNEVFDIPVMKQCSDFTKHALDSAGTALGYGDLTDLFTCMDYKDGYNEWIDRINMSSYVRTEDKDRKSVV